MLVCVLIQVCDTVLVVPPELHAVHFTARNEKRFTDLRAYTMFPWSALETVLLHLAGAQVSSAHLQLISQDNCYQNHLVQGCNQRQLQVLVEPAVYTIAAGA
jgi:hypothetical protein